MKTGHVSRSEMRDDFKMASVPDFGKKSPCLSAGQGSALCSRHDTLPLNCFSLHPGV